MVVKSHLHKITLDFEKEIFLTITTTNLYKTKNMSDSSKKLQELPKFIVTNFNLMRKIKFRQKYNFGPKIQFRTKNKILIQK